MGGQGYIRVSESSREGLGRRLPGGGGAARVGAGPLCGPLISRVASAASIHPPASSLTPPILLQPQPRAKHF